MIAKMARYDHTVTPESFKAAVIPVADGGSEGAFDLARLRSDPDVTRRMLARLTAEHDAISTRLAGRLQSFTPDNVDLHATMFVLVGAKHQNGWVPDNAPNFYVDLGFHREEMESMTNSAAHELFHVVQVTVQPIDQSQLTDQPGLPVDARELHRAHAVVLNLVIEGMATYVGDASIYTATGPRLTHDQDQLKKELARATDIFALFDTILFRARHDPDAPLDPLLNIGFGGSWDETGYFVGYRMAKTIDRYSGRDRLRALVSYRPKHLSANTSRSPKPTPVIRRSRPSPVLHRHDQGIANDARAIGRRPRARPAQPAFRIPRDMRVAFCGARLSTFDFRLSAFRREAFR